MARDSAIEWTEATWNPVTGCTKISIGCEHCYAERMAKRLHAMSQRGYERGFEVTLHHRLIDLPMRWRKPTVIFVNSMGDLFHEKVPLSFVQRVFHTMSIADRHIYQVLTKRSERLRQIGPGLPWASHIWAGVTVETADYIDRVNDLRQCGAHVKFISLEPLLGQISHLDLSGIDWVIVGGESGPGARPMRPEWVAEVRDACLLARVPFFFKQWGGVQRKKAGRLLEGRIWDEHPPLPDCYITACQPLRSH